MNVSLPKTLASICYNLDLHTNPVLFQDVRL